MEILVIRKFVKDSQDWWECGMCHIKTFGEWDAEAKLNTDEDTDDNWHQLCKACTFEIKKTFIEMEDG